MRRFLNLVLALAIVTSLSLASLAQVDLAETAADAAETAVETVTEAAEAAEEVAEAATDAAAEEAAEATAEATEAAVETATEAVAEETAEATEPAPEVAEPEAPAAEPAAPAPEVTPEVEAAVETPAAVPVMEASAPSVDEVIAESTTPMVVEPMVVASPVVESAACCEPVCCPIEVVSSRVRLAARRAYACHGGPIETTVCVDNPADCSCQQYAVPLCVPCCCVGEPQVCGTHTGLLGRGHVMLQWSCGFTAKVTFLVRGGVTVVYGG